MNYFQKKIAELKAVLTETKFAEAKLIDGTIVRSEGETFEPKQKLEAITEDGSVVTAPEGMHETTDGEILVVDDKGFITEVRKAEPKIETEMEQTEEEIVEEEIEMEEVIDEVVEAVVVIDQQVASLEERIKQLEDELNKSNEELNKFKSENKELKDKLTQPIVQPSNHKKIEKLFKSESKKDENNMISVLRNLKK